MNTKIKKVWGTQILDSRGNPTVRAYVETEDGIRAEASVPSGASVGIKEALELRDNDKNIYLGKGVLGAVNNINEKISKLITGTCVLNQKYIDEKMIEADGSENKSNYGANAILAVSLACARCAAMSLDVPLYSYLGGINAITMPTPMINIINGGAHANNTLDFQEFMITPTGADSFHDAIRMAVETFHTLNNILKKKKYSTATGDEGGFAPNLSSNKEALDLIVEAIDTAGYSTDEIKICLDAASSEFYHEGRYELKAEGLLLNKNEMVQYLKNLVEDYPIISIEDGMAQDDYEGWRILTDCMSCECLLVGDDLFVTNTKLLLEGMKENIANAILIKLNQIGTLTETLDTIRLANKGGYKTIISHRSGETEDTFIADLATGVNAGLIKTGSMSRGERISKYNRLLDIERELNLKYRGCDDLANYLGLSAYFDRHILESSSCKGGCSRRM